MALFQCEFRSEVLKILVSMQVIVPQRSMLRDNEDGVSLEEKSLSTSDGKWPVLYLLHGLSDNQTAWTRYTAIERYAYEAGIAVVMPAVNRSFYTNMWNGSRYFDFVSDEVPEAARQFFPITSDPAFTFVAGLSMGGYGAFKMAFTYPERFAAAISLSGAVDAGAILQMDDPEIAAEFALVFKDHSTFVNSGNDLHYLVQELKKNKTDIPKLYMSCGTEDFLYTMNTGFRDYLQKAGVTLYWQEGKGAHEWGYWDMEIQKVLRWIKSGSSSWVDTEVVW